MNVLETVLNHLATAVVVIDQNSGISDMNSAAEALLEISAGRAQGRSLNELGLESELLQNAVADVVASGRSVTVREMELHRPPVSSDLLVDCSVSPGASDNLILEFSRVDRLARIRREDDMRDQHTANQTIIRGLSHEIKNPLGGLRGAAQLLDAELKDHLKNRDLREYTRIITHEADRLTRLVDRLVASHRPFDIQSVNIHEVIEYVRKLVLVDVQERLSFKRDYDPSLPEIQGDKEQLIQAVLNVINNAVHAMDKSGEIVLRTRVDRQITINDTCHKNVIRVDIQDTGPGVPEEIKDRVFYPMVTGSPEGTGLGLSITHEIITRHNGMVECHSEPGNTVFTFYLPLE